MMIFETSKHVPKTEKRCCVFKDNKKFCSYRNVCSPVFLQSVKFSQVFLLIGVHFFQQGLGILCSPLHGDVGAVTRTVGLKHNKLIDTS